MIKNKDPQLFGIINDNSEHFCSVSDDGKCTYGNEDSALRLNVVELEEKLAIIKKYSIPYKVKAFSIKLD